MPTVSAFNTISSYKKGSGDLRVDTSHNQMPNFNGNSNGNIPTSPTPYIKNEPLDSPPDHPRRFQPHGFADSYSMNNAGYSHQSPGYNAHNYESIDPSALTMSPLSGDQQGSMPRNIPGQNNNNFGQSYATFNSGAGYLGAMGITTDELLSLDLSKNGMDGYSHNPHEPISEYDLHLLNHDIPIGTGTLDSGYSHTPDTADSHFSRPYQYRQMHTLGSTGVETSPSYASSINRNSIDINGSHKSNQSKSPNTPKTPGLGGMSINGTESSSLAPQPIQNHHMGIHRHHKSMPSGQWDGTPSSQVSYMDSPLSSPGVGSSGHAQISEMMKAKHASLPSKVENGGPPGYQTQEAKRRRRRESHNMVERRRRDNINERIQELSHLVPQHRLEDEKVRKHLQNNSPLSPTIGATGTSPTRATSMLAGGVGRRASGVTGVNLPGDEKDKGPNKGDILNGAVSWTRDLMWCLSEKYKQEEKLREWASQNGLKFPVEITEDERRMKSELVVSMERNSSVTRKFAYTRGPGSGLRVPGYTDIAGAHITISASGVTSPSVSPVHASVAGGRSASSTGSAATSLSRVHSSNGPQYWPNDNMLFKEEEFGTMDLS